MGARNGESIYIVNRNPTMIDRTVQDHFAGLVPAAKDIRDNLEVRESVLDTGEVFGYLNGEIDMFLDLPDTSLFSGFLISNLITRKFPQTAK